MKKTKKKRKFTGLKLRKVLKAPKLKTLRRVAEPLAGVPDKLLGRDSEVDAKLVQAIQNLPRITNETVAEHREEVLSSARKYIYPLSHSKRRVVVITSGLLVLAIIIFFSYCTLALYRFKSTSTFVYGVTQVVPFPVAKAGNSWVSYESYLFELRHSMHYYQTQQKSDFTSKSGKSQLAKLEQDSLNQVIEDAYVKQLAAKNHVSVSTREVNNQVALLRVQNRLGSSDQVFRNVLSEYWGWTTDDFKRELKQQMLAQAVVAKLDTGTQTRAQNVLTQLNNSGNFAAIASQASDDASTKANGGNYGVAITQTNRDLPIQVINELFKLKAGQYSGVINTGTTLEIDKVIDTNGTSVHAARIVFKLQPLSKYVQPVQAKAKSHTYITITQPKQ